MLVTALKENGLNSISKVLSEIVLLDKKANKI